MGLGVDGVGGIFPFFPFFFFRFSSFFFAFLRFSLLFFVFCLFSWNNPKHQNLLFWDLSLFLTFRLKSPNLVDFWSRKCLFYWVRRKRFRLILKTRDF